MITQFRSPQNIDYLRGFFASKLPAGPLRSFVLDTLTDAVYGFGLAEVLAYSDPLAQRGDLRPAANMWSEVSRLNLAFYTDRLNSLRDNAALVSGTSGDGQWDDNEPYHFRMFTADSLRPPGLEGLNTPGPLYGILEDQVADRHSAGPQAPGVREGFAAGPRSGGAPPRAAAGPEPMAGVCPAEWGWSEGDHTRTAEQAISEYWGEGRAATPGVEPARSALGAAELAGNASNPKGIVNGSLYAWGDDWQKNGGTRFMRREGIPFWQKGGGHAHEADIEEGLGTGIREADNHVRRWSTETLKNNRGEENRRYGPRSGAHV